MQEAAHDLATRNTFQNELTGFSKKLGEAIAAKPNVAWLPESAKSVSPLKFLFPFYKTPVNLFKATITHATPYELLNGIAKGDTDTLARGIVGSSIAAALAAAALSGHITGGGPTDFRKRRDKALNRMGNRTPSRLEIAITATSASNRLDWQPVSLPMRSMDLRAAIVKW